MEKKKRIAARYLTGTPAPKAGNDGWKLGTAGTGTDSPTVEPNKKQFKVLTLASK